jgi:hypothetical protein
LTVRARRLEAWPSVFEEVIMMKHHRLSFVNDEDIVMSFEVEALLQMLFGRLLARYHEI